MPKFHITTLGCKVNQCESAGLASKLANSGWQQAQGGQAADLFVINTCAVTGKAAMQSRQAVRQAVRENPGARVVVTGCYAQIDPQTLADIDGVAAVMGTGEKLSIADRPNTDVNDTPVICCADVMGIEKFDPLPQWGATDRTRPFLKIQDGCNAHCTYCIVPSARGRSRSLAPDLALAQLRALGQAGFQETVLTGIHLGCYGHDLTPPTTLADLLRQMDGEGAMERVRISSVEPKELCDAIIDCIANAHHLCPHVHTPLQSGDDGVLRKMARPYTRDFFRDRILAAHRRIPDCAIGVDVLSGFPGESQAAFENTVGLLEDLPITYLHVFPFSSRPGTPASRMANPVPSDVIKARCTALRELGREKKRAFYSGFIGRSVRVLVEGSAPLPPGTLRGISDHYLPVLFSGSDDLKETFVTVRIERMGPNLELFGTRA